MIPYRDRIQFDTLNLFKLKEIQAQDCMIVNISDKIIQIDTNKKAIYCSPTESSDILFKQSEVKVMNYLKNLYDYLNVPVNNLLTKIEIAPEDIVKGSSIASNFKEKQYSVIITKNVMETFKISNFLKKNKLKKHLVLISKSRITVTDPYLSIYKDHSYLDLLAFQIEATNVSCPNASMYEKVISNLRINLSLFASYKDPSFLLFDMSEPKTHA